MIGAILEQAKVTHHVGVSVDTAESAANVLHVVIESPDEFIESIVIFVCARQIFGMAHVGNAAVDGKALAVGTPVYGLMSVEAMPKISASNAPLSLCGH